MGQTEKPIGLLGKVVIGAGLMGLGGLMHAIDHDFYAKHSQHYDNCSVSIRGGRHIDKLPEDMQAKLRSIEKTFIEAADDEYWYNMRGEEYLPDNFGATYGALDDRDELLKGTGITAKWYYQAFEGGNLPMCNRSMNAWVQFNYDTE